ncbi:hypothetical protein [Endozoicomonas sp. 8E]|uniref:hypothetical protein n=1 Tax=Endozoicomonas sp. 8E TaxID=3035692 RepID=UPI00293931AF|nr:hypothetical protein [Endozoicomonas sp. 8E]WOG27106.1 hypothetical protein P6910_21525 [Endozoicomonas sp. 8E]
MNDLPVSSCNPTESVTAAVTFTTDLSGPLNDDESMSGSGTCDVSMVGEDGLQRLCGTVCKNANYLTEYKRKHNKRKLFDEKQKGDFSP